MSGPSFWVNRRAHRRGRTVLAALARMLPAALRSSRLVTADILLICREARLRAVLRIYAEHYAGTGRNQSRRQWPPDHDESAIVPLDVPTRRRKLRAKNTSQPDTRTMSK
jgi:hypothetical protein